MNISFDPDLEACPFIFPYDESELYSLPFSDLPLTSSVQALISPPLPFYSSRPRVHYYFPWPFCQNRGYWKSSSSFAYLFSEEAPNETAHSLSSQRHIFLPPCFLSFWIRNVPFYIQSYPYHSTACVALCTKWMMDALALEPRPFWSVITENIFAGKLYYGPSRIGSGIRMRDISPELSRELPIKTCRHLERSLDIDHKSSSQSDLNVLAEEASLCIDRGNIARERNKISARRSRARRKIEVEMCQREIMITENRLAANADEMMRLQIEKMFIQKRLREHRTRCKACAYALLSIEI